MLGRKDKVIQNFENTLKKAQNQYDYLMEEDTKGMSRKDKQFHKESIEYAKNKVERYTEILEFVREFDINEVKSEGGQVYEVDLPENPYLLDEEKLINNQDEHIRRAVRNIMNSFPDSYIEGDDISNFGGLTGETFYRALMNIGARQGVEGIKAQQKFASETLEKHGIKGITYEGGQDGRCFVIFNPDDVKVIQKFYQDSTNGAKGAFAQNLDQKGVIYLFEDADASTFMHETAHFFRKELEEFGTARSKEMLQKMVEWENSEFDKRYDVQQTANGFVVTDKLGNVVYGDKKPFQSVQSAREYGRNEIFARGFEQYLRDGKAPSNYLKQAFRSFWSWLRSLYRSAKALNVDINDNIRSVYNEIIGGADLDFYLSAPVDEVLQQRVAESKDREEYLEDVIKRAQAKPHKGVSGWIKEKTESDKGLVKWWNAAIVPISTRAKRVNIKLRNRLRAYDYAVNNKYNEFLNVYKETNAKLINMVKTVVIEEE